MNVISIFTEARYTPITFNLPEIFNAYPGLETSLDQMVRLMVPLSLNEGFVT